MPDLYSNIHLLVRWLHVIAGIVWIGHLYFFNFVNLPLQAALDDPTKKAVNPQLMPRALWWFRWGAMITFLAGLILFVMVYLYTPGVGFGPNSLFIDADGLTGRGAWILLGMLLATVMWFNVWMIIWPTQKKLLTAKVPQDQIPAARKKAALASRVNTYLSAPMLFGMLAPSHYGTMHPAALMGAVVIAELAVFLAYKKSSAVGKLS
ncbi:MAG: urate hydroxylase PuuD [Candidatus Omnitrophica bacterium]|nr:urate hydroxylase PuuD [Candidatus Omnitrophota bacterium]